MTQLERFRATMAHERHDEWLYYASFTPDLERRVRERFGLGPKDSIAAYFDMYAPVNVSMRPRGR